MRILQINTSLNTSAPGRIASEIGDSLISMGHESIIGYGRDCRKSRSIPIKIGNDKDLLVHLIKTRLFDHHGFGSAKATKRFISQVEEISPDLIHLHNLHGYYMNVGILFNYLKKADKPVVWTFHDCWPFTGHCSYFDRANCQRWQSQCSDCPLKKGYPASWIFDNSRWNYNRKKELFTSVDNMTLVSPSSWLANHLSDSFLKEYPATIINNGININEFRPVEPDLARNKHKLSGKHVILGVANVWSKRKGLSDFIKLRGLLVPDIDIVLVGLSKEQIRKLPTGIFGINRTDSINDLAALYSLADVFVNPTYVDNFPTTNIEALACGTPVVTYITGGSAESVSGECGFTVIKGQIGSLKEAIHKVLQLGKGYFSNSCRERAVKYYNKDERYSEYLKLYNTILKNNLSFI